MKKFSYEVCMIDEDDKEKWLMMGCGEFEHVEDAINEGHVKYQDAEFRVKACSDEEYAKIREGLHACPECVIGRLTWTPGGYECDECDERFDEDEPDLIK